jgi:hypothetical protein
VDGAEGAPCRAILVDFRLKMDGIGETAG